MKKKTLPLSVSIIIVVILLLILYNGFNRQILPYTNGTSTVSTTSITNGTQTNIENDAKKLLESVIRYGKKHFKNVAENFCGKLGLKCHNFTLRFDEISANTFVERITNPSFREALGELPPTIVTYNVVFKDQRGRDYSIGISAYTGLAFVFTNWSAYDLSNKLTCNASPSTLEKNCYAIYVENKTMFNHIKSKTLKILHAMGYKFISDLMLKRDPFSGETDIYYDGEGCKIIFIPVINDIQAIPPDYLIPYKPYLIGVFVEVKVPCGYPYIMYVKISRELGTVLEEFSKINITSLISRQEALGILREWVQSNLSNNVYYKVVSYHVVNVSLGYAIEYKRVNYTFIFKLKLFWVIPTIVLDENGGEHKYIILVDAKSGEVKRV